MRAVVFDDFDVGIPRLVIAPEQIEQAGTRKKERDVIGSLKPDAPRSRSGRTDYQTQEARAIIRNRLATRLLDASKLRPGACVLRSVV